MINLIRFGISMDENLLKKFDNIISKKGYVNRSEAIRDLIRNMMDTDEISDPDIEAVGTLSLVYNHDVRDLADKLNEIQHKYYKNIKSTTHIHLDEHNCLEILVLMGKARIINEISDRLIAIKNVKHGKLSLTPVETK